MVYQQIWNGFDVVIKQKGKGWHYLIIKCETKDKLTAKYVIEHNGITIKELACSWAPEIEYDLLIRFLMEAAKENKLRYLRGRFLKGDAELETAFSNNGFKIVQGGSVFKVHKG